MKGKININKRKKESKIGFIKALVHLTNKELKNKKSKNEKVLKAF
jgi:hypothetical protein